MNHFNSGKEVEVDWRVETDSTFPLLPRKVKR